MAYIERNHEGYYDPTASTALQTIEREERAKRLGFMPLIYICSPYAGDIARNVQNARRYCAFALMQKALPVAPHLLFPQFMDGGRLPGGEETEETRELALHMGLILLTKCHELWYFGDTVSDGMKMELNRARWRNMVVRHFTDDCTEVQI
jgi:hypothetical protein